MTQPAPPARLHPAHALCVYAEPLVDGRRVVVVGDSSLDVGTLLVEAGARVVHVYDPSRERARANAGVARGVTVRELTPEFEVRDGAFDVAIVPDLASTGDAPALLARLRRLVGVEGAVLVAARNPDLVGPGPETIDYTDLYDMVALQFSHVRMVGQVPFSGVTLAELGLSEDPEVSVDTRLAPDDRTPHVFVALGSQKDVSLAPYALVELPAPPVVTLPDAPLRAALAEARLKADLLTAQLEEARTLTQRAATDAESSRAKRVRELEEHIAAIEARAGEHFVRAERLSQEVSALDAELGRQRARAVELEEQAGDYKRMRAHSEVELTATRASVAELEERAMVLGAELEAVRAAADVPQVDPEAVARLAMRAEQAERAAEALVQLEADLLNAGELHAEELAQVEQQLRERAKTIQTLEHEIVRRERLVKELVAALEEAHAAPGAPHAHAQHAAPPEDAAELVELRRENRALKDKLDRLALDVARREGDLQAQAWRVTELEQKVAMEEARAGASPAKDPEAERDLLRARAELDALRQALAQEHEARTRVESGEALAKAQAELARQATLIEQLSRELDAKDRVRRPEPMAD